MTRKQRQRARRVTAMRRLGATGHDGKKLVPAMTMLREMTDPPETNN